MKAVIFTPDSGGILSITIGKTNVNHNKLVPAHKSMNLFINCPFKILPGCFKRPNQTIQDLRLA